MKKLCLVLLTLAYLPALAVGQVVEEIIARVNNQIVTRSEFVRSKDQLKDEVKQQEAIHLSEILIAPKLPADTAAPAKSGATDGSAATLDSSNAQQPADRAAKQALEEAALAAAKAKADDVLDQIRKGASFDEIAKKYSDGPSASQGGDLGVFKRGALAKEMEDKTSAMKTGDVSEVIRTKQGYVILKVTEHQMAGVPEMKDIAPKIQDALYYQKLQPSLRAYLTKLREDAYIKINPGYLDTGASPNQTVPIETTAAKEADAKKLSNKRKKKLGVL